MKYFGKENYQKRTDIGRLPVQKVSPGMNATFSRKH